MLFGFGFTSTAVGHQNGTPTVSQPVPIPPSLINELGQLLDHAAQQNVYVILCLWNLAAKPEKMMHLFTDDRKLDSYLEKVLKPIASALKDKPALAAYDIINEPAGSFAQAVADPEPCFDTMILKYTGTDWTHSHIHIKDMLRFVNHHSDAIKSVSQTLVTVGDGDQTMTTITPNSRNYYSDHCLQLAGGRPRGVLGMFSMILIYLSCRFYNLNQISTNSTPIPGKVSSPKAVPSRNEPMTIARINPFWWGSSQRIVVKAKTPLETTDTFTIMITRVLSPGKKLRTKGERDALIRRLWPTLGWQQSHT